MREIRLGFSIGQIKQIIELVLANMDIPSMIDNSVRAKLTAVDQRITEFQEF